MLRLQPTTTLIVLPLLAAWSSCQGGVAPPRERSVEVTEVEAGRRGQDGLDRPTTDTRSSLSTDLTGSNELGAAALTANVQSSPASYLVIDVSAGPTAASYPVEILDALPAELETSSTYRADKILLRRIPAGRFTMGSPPDEVGRKANEQQHDVTITKDFYIGVFEVTQRQWLNVMGGENPSAHVGDGLPVERVSWETVRGGDWDGASEGAAAAASFMGRLASRTDIPCDLPTEAQWEYACRAGTTTALNDGSNLGDTTSSPTLDKLGRYRGNKGGGWRTVVGSYAPNAWGLYDMHGNVYEWCLDRYQASLGEAPTVDPGGAEAGQLRVEKGGCWYSTADVCRSAARYRVPAEDAHGNLGFRLTSAGVSSKPN